jgi:heterodisulfide reductase subunit B
MTETGINDRLVRAVLEKTGENAYLCYQCIKCSAGCPLAEYFDLTPNQVMRAVQLGREERVLNSKTIWLCASCQTCTTRCPQGIDLARIMDALKSIAQEKGIKPKVPEVATFHKVFLRNVNILGRAYELGLIAEMNLRTGQPFKDVGMGLEMITKGKVRILPSVARPPRQPKRMAQPGEIAYYPGCSLHSLSSELDESTRTVCDVLGLKVVEPQGWTCCGSSAVHGADPVVATTLPIQNLALVEKSGFDEVMAPCSACLFRFKSALHDLREEDSLKTQVANRIHYEYRDSVRVLSVLDLFEEKVGMDAIATHVKKPLHGLRVVSYYGCLLTRPPKITGANHVENPRQMDQIMVALGAEPVDWSYKTECCGGSLSLTRTDLALALTRKILLAARALGADAITTSCPLCHVNLDARQAQIGLDFQMPVLFISQFMGLAFGIEPQRLAVHKHMVSVKPVLDKIG